MILGQTVFEIFEELISCQVNRAIAIGFANVRSFLRHEIGKGAKKMVQRIVSQLCQRMALLEINDVAPFSVQTNLIIAIIIAKVFAFLGKMLR